MQQQHSAFCSTVDQIFEEMRDITDQKQFAAQLKHCIAEKLPADKQWPPVFFEMKKDDVPNARFFFSLQTRLKYQKLFNTWQKASLSQGHGHVNRT